MVLFHLILKTKTKLEICKWILRKKREKKIEKLMKQFDVNEAVQCYLDIFDVIKVIKSLILLCIIRLLYSFNIHWLQSTIN